MFLIIGLGNPGIKFRGTRHNLGFSVLDAFKKKHQFSNWQHNKKLKSKISQGKIAGKEIILAKPQTFMNSSGQAAKLLINYHKSIYGSGRIYGSPTAIDSARHSKLLIVHDDLDIPLGRIKISRGRGSAGHKGVQSIIDALGTSEFLRIRLGLGKSYGGRTSANFVLQKFSGQEKKIIRQTKKRAIEALEMTIRV